jgi:hypothetical protein
MPMTSESTAPNASEYLAVMWPSGLCILWLLNTDSGLEYIKGFNQLFQLQLDNTQVANEGVHQLQKTLPNCEIQLKN